MSDAPTKKDNWDRFTAVATILVPAAIALAGHYVGQGLKQAEISNAEANKKIAQASLIGSLMGSLTSDDAQERTLAIGAVMIALPEQGPVLVQTVLKNDEDETVRAAAKASLERRVSELISQLYSESAPVRIGASQELIRDWKNDPDVVLGLVEFATKNSDNREGIYNTIVALNVFSPSALQAHRAEILNFIEVAEANGKKTKAKAADLVNRLGDKLGDELG